MNTQIKDYISYFIITALTILMLFTLIFALEGCNTGSISPLSSTTTTIPQTITFEDIYFTTTQFDKNKQKTTFTTTEPAYSEFEVNTYKNITVTVNYYWNGSLVFSKDEVLIAGDRIWSKNLAHTYPGTYRVQIMYEGTEQLVGEIVVTN